MRGVAALLVVVGHYRGEDAPSFYLAVDFFYLLSGFVIAEAYTKKLQAGMSLVDFLRQRLLRLYPLYFIGMLLGLVQIFVLVETQDLVPNYLELGISTAANLFILPSPVYLIFAHRPGEIYGFFPTNGPAWSIFWEFVINIAFAIFLFRARLWAVVSVAVFGFVGLIVCAYHYGNLSLGWEWRSFEGGLFRVAFAFNVGVLLSRFRLHLPRVHSYFALVPSLLLAVLLVLNPIGQTRILYDLVFCLVAAPIIVGSGIVLEVPKVISKICYYAGYISYPIYILHRGVIKIAELAIEKFHLPHIVGIVVLLIGLCIFAFFTAALMEILTRHIVGSPVKSKQ
jgi:peptidoglycan/LPS O-acetylase OafA/YrhL